MDTSSARPHSPSNDYPVRQLIILSLCRICEPIAFCSLFPYIYYMVDSFKIAKNDHEIALYAGMVTSVFALGEFAAGMWWGRISDKFGRKPVLIGGLIGTLVSMMIFGFAKSYPVALLARAAGGLLNGNIGVIQTTLAELVPRKENQPRAFSIIPLVWAIGSIIGPAVGGALADPIRQYPEIFKPGGFLEEYPYALPNLVCSTVLFLGIFIGILFLEETHGELKHRRDYGRDLGRMLTRSFTSPFYKNMEAAEDRRKLLAENARASEAGYHTFSDQSSLTIIDELVPPSKLPSTPPLKPPSVRKIFTPQIIHLTISYGILAFHTIAFGGLYPIFLSTPKADKPPSSLFRFVGGFGLSASEVGLILSVQGVLAMFIQFSVVPYLIGRFGAFSVYRVVMLLFPLSYVIVPYLDFVPTDFKYASIYIPLIIQVLFAALTYLCNTILLTNSAPSFLELGTINGFAGSIASLARAFGPILSGMTYTYGLKIGYVGLAWWANGAVCIIGAIQVFWILDPVPSVPDMDEGESME